MSRNGSGTYSLPEAAFQNGTAIDATAVNNNFTDIASALTASLAKDGQTTPTADLPMGSKKHTGVANASARTHYTAYGQVQDDAPNWAGTSGGTADVQTLTPTPAITAYAAGQRFRFIAGSGLTNTGACTINVSAVGAKDVKAVDGTAPDAGAITAGNVHEVVYDGTNLVLLWQSTPASLRSFAGLGTAATASTGTSGTTVPLLDGDNTYSGAATFTDDVDMSGAGTVTHKVNSVALGDIATIAEARVLGRASGAGTGDTTALTAAQVKAVVSPAGGVFVAGATGSLSSTGVNVTDLGGVTAPTRITIAFSAASLSGTDNLLIQIGDAGGIETSGYVSGATATASSSGTYVSSTSGFIVNIGVAARAFSGIMTIVHVGSNVWVASVAGNDTVAAITGGGTKTLSGALTQIQITRTGSDTFDAGTYAVFSE